jgi:hypothetical protein
MHAVERADEDREVFFVACNGNGLVDEAISLRLRDADDSARVEFHPFGVGFVGVAHVFGFLVAKSGAKDFGFVFYDVLGGSYGGLLVLVFAEENTKVNEGR